jgi:serine/threonine protein kinase/Tol biopolymer transport system component
MEGLWFNLGQRKERWSSGCMVGKTVQNYRIVEIVGQGGMGTVYKALDLRLNRFLALKFLLPERITADRKRRFFQEAKAASALNHPSIVHIYDIGQWEGADFIAMEYVEGRTVQQMLRDGPMQIDDALRYSIQVADAMSVAHTANIVHRDLKPANVMVTARGLVKILDFGVAKLNEPAVPRQVEERPPSAETLTYIDVNQTMEGMVVGSPAYMSPEQATGKPVDSRSDIFEFGVLLHEMLTGQAAFSGGTKLEVLSAILRTDPPRPSSINPAVSPELEWVIAHCLRKDRERRFQSMSEVKVALDDLRTETSVSGFRAPVLPPPQVTVSSISTPAVPAPRRNWIWGIATAAGLLCATALALLLLRPGKQSATGPLEITRLTTEGGLCIDPAISPDGKLLAYASDRSGEGHLSLWLRQIGGGDAVRLTHGEADDVEPDFSPDGTRIVFRSTREGGGLYAIPALGGEARKVAGDGRQPQFSPDGSKVAYWVGPADPLPLRDGVAHAFILDLASSTSRRLRTDFPASTHPIWNPDGKYVGFLGLKDPKNIVGTYDWWLTAIDGSSPAVKIPLVGLYYFVNPFAWRGDRVYAAKEDKDRTTIGEVRIDPKQWKPVGELRPLTAGTTNEYSPSVSRDGRLVFASVSATTQVYSLPLDANQGKVRGALERLTRDTGVDKAGSISADGKRIAYISNQNGSDQVWVKDLASGAERALTTGTQKMDPVISPDGQRVAWTENVIQNHQISVTPFDGGPATQLCSECDNPRAWSPDGQFLIYATVPDTFLGLLNVVTGKATPYVKVYVSRSAMSPDGKWIAFTARRSGRDYTIFVAPFSPSAPPAQSEWVEILRSPEVNPGPGWSQDGNLLYFSSERDGYACLWALRLDPMTKQPRGKLFAVQHFHTPAQRMTAPSRGYPVAVSGDKMTVSLEERSGGIWMLSLKD